MDKSYIYQVSIREWIENDWDKGIFVPVYGGRKDDKWDIFFQSYLVPADRTEEQLKTDTYDAYGQELLLMEHGILEKPRIISGEIMRV